MLILHLSDIHFRHPRCNTEADPELHFRNAMTRDIRDMAREHGDVQAILVTGDIAFQGKPEEYEAAQKWFNEVARAAGCRQERIYVVPGNHDVDRSVSRDQVSVKNAQEAILIKEAISDRERELARQLGNLETAELLYRPLQAYNDFAVRYGCNIYPAQPFWSAPLKIDHQTVLHLRGLNSTMLSGARNDVKGQELMLGMSQCSLPMQPGSINLILSHHPPDWLADCDEVGSRLLGHPNILLFGHKHQQKVDRHVHGPMVFSAGSVNPDRVETGWMPAYNLIEMTVDGEDEERDLRITVWQRTWQDNPTAFVSKEDANANPRTPYFEHVIKVRGYPEISEESITPREEDPSNLVEEPMTVQSVSERNILLRFWDLKGNSRHEIMVALELIDPKTPVRDETREYSQALASIDTDRYERLEKLVQEREEAGG